MIAPRSLNLLGLVVVVAAAVGLAAGFSLRETPEPEKPLAPAPPASPAQAKDEPRRDRYGDPLPPGAIARLGTLRFRVDAEIQGLAFSPDGKTLATAVRDSGAIHICDVARRTMKAEPEGHSHRPDRPSFSPDGKRLATSSNWEGTIRIWNAATGESLLRIHRQGWMHDGVFSADGRTLYSCNGNTLFFFEASSGRQSQALKIEDPDRPKARQSGLNLYLSDDGARLLVFSSDDTHREELMTVWDIATRKRLEQCRAGK